MKEMNSIIKLKNIEKEYILRNEKVNVFDNLNINFELGKFYLITGHSGCGKSTLVNILGLLLNFDNGEYYFDNQDIKDCSNKELSEIRSKKIGFVFQNYNLSPTLKAYENVILPMMINNNIKRNERYNKAKDLLKKVGLEDRINHFPREMSGGEQQRVAIARALANNPCVILADEPTGNLDKKNEQKIFKILKELSLENKCVIVVSHSVEAKEFADIIYELDDGHLIQVKR